MGTNAGSYRLAHDGFDRHARRHRFHGVDIHCHPLVRRCHTRAGRPAQPCQARHRSRLAIVGTTRILLAASHTSQRSGTRYCGRVISTAIKTVVTCRRFYACRGTHHDIHLSTKAGTCRSANLLFFATCKYQAPISRAYNSSGDIQCPDIVNSENFLYRLHTEISRHFFFSR